MKLIINSQEKEIKDNLSIEEILELLGIKKHVMATALNMDIVKKEDWAKIKPKDGDKLEFLQFVGGG